MSPRPSSIPDFDFPLYCSTYFPSYNVSDLTPPPAGYKLCSSDPCLWLTPSGDYVYWSPLPSKTLQGPAVDADINNIVARLQSGATLPPPSRPFYYGDATLSPGSLAEALSVVAEARQAFFMLPPQIRQALGNDPAQLEGFLADPDNRAVALKYGLLEAPTPVPDPLPAAAAVPPAPPVAPPPPPPPAA